MIHSVLSIDRILQQSNEDEVFTWQPLRHFNYYRLVLSIALLSAFFITDWMNFLGNQNPQAYLITSTVMLLSSFLYIGMSLSRKPDFEKQVIITNVSDILLLTLLAHFSGGLSSSLSILLIINVTATGTFLREKNSFLFAALASIAILGEQTYSLSQNISYATEYSRAGLLGLAFFGTSFLASTLAKRVRESEQLAFEREADIISLEILNEDIIQNMRTGIIVVDSNGHIQLANSSAESLLGNVSLQDHPLLEYILPSLDMRLIEWQEQPNIHHKPIIQAHGLPNIQPGFRKLQRTGDTLIFLEDATQLNQRFQQIKLASLGKLTASIAHEIRNPLSAINHASQLLQESDHSEADKKLTNIITTQVQRLDKVIENVLQLSRQQDGDVETIVLNQWLRQFHDEFLQSNDLNPEQVQLEIPDDNVTVLFDPSHLSQVMSNLCNNAIIHNNLPKEQTRTLIVCGYDSQFDQPYIDIIDNGPGISKETIEQIFDPFFTTSSKGTGLGLYISKEILESNRAKIRYLKTENGSSCFRIHFLSPVKHNKN